MYKFYLFLILALGSVVDSQGQHLHQRIEADISIKEIGPERTSLLIGKVFFDVKNDYLVYQISFPEKEIMIVTQDEIISRKDTVIKHLSTTPFILDFSIYKLVLTADLKFFGLNKDLFDIRNVKTTASGIQSDWYPKNLEEANWLRIVQEKGNIKGMGFYDYQNILLSKQLFSDYATHGRISFPLDIYDLSYIEGQEYHKKLTTHSKIKIDDYSNEDNLYNALDHLSNP